MTELETLERAKMYIEKLANGINPIDNSNIPDGEVVNNVRLSRCFFYVADVLERVIDSGGVTAHQKPKKQAFDLPIDVRCSFEFSGAPITLSEIARRVNALIDEATMKKLTYNMLAEWLVSIGFLEQKLTADGRNTRRASSLGKTMGILEETRTGANGPYTATVYNIEAQRFILDNLDSVVEREKAKLENLGKAWTPEEDQHLLELYRNDASTKEISAALKRSNGAVRARLKKHGKP